MLTTNFGSIASSESGIWLNGWNYGKKLIIPESKIDTDLSYFPVTAYLNTTNFNFSLAKSDGSDIRFTDKDLNHLKFEKKEHNATPALILYDYGDEKTSITGGWTVQSNTYGAGIAVKNSDNLEFGESNTSGYGTSYFIATNQIDLTIYATLKVECEVLGNVEYPAPNANVLGAGVRTTNTASGTSSYSMTAAAVVSTTNTNTVAKSIYSVDIVALTGNYYIQTVAQGMNYANEYIYGRVYKIWLEPSSSSTDSAVYNIQVPIVSSTMDTEIYMWYGNTNAYNTSIEAWRDMTGKALTYNGNVKLVSGVETGKRVASFDGTGDWFTINSVLNSNVFTVEAMVKLDLTQTTQTLIDIATHTRLVISMNRASYTTGTTAIFIGNGTSWLGSPAIASSNQLTSGWHHIAFVCDGTQSRLYHDGVNVGSSSIVPTVGLDTRIRIGGLANNDTSSEFFKGSISRYKVTKRARYTANFTPPTSFDIDGSDVVFCTNFDTIYDNNYAMVQHMGDSLVDATGNGNNGTATGTTVVNTDYGKARSFNGTSEKISVGDVETGNYETVLALFRVVTPMSTCEPIYNKGYTSHVAPYYQSAMFYAPVLFCDFAINGVRDSREVAGLVGTADEYHTLAHKFNGSAHSIIHDAGVASNYSVAGTINNYATNAYIGGYTNLATVNDYFGGVINAVRISNIARSDAWIKAESLSLKNNLFVIENANELLADVIVTTQTTSINITGLNIGKDDEIVLVSFLERGSFAPPVPLSLGIYCNNNNSDTNYYTQYISANDTTLAASIYNRSEFIFIDPNQSRSYSRANIKLTNSGYFTCQNDIVRNIGSSIMLHCNYNASIFTLSSITQLTITSQAQDQIGAGSRFQLYRTGRGI